MLLDRTAKELIVAQALVDVYRDEFSSLCITGVISEISYSFLHLRRYDEEGRYDGVSILRKDDITRLGWGGREREAIARLVAQAGERPVRPKIELDSFQSVIRSLQGQFGHVVLYSEDLDLETAAAGEIEEMDEEHLVVRLFGAKESLDRPYGLLHLGDITRVEADSIALRNLVSLHRKAVRGQIQQA